MKTPLRAKVKASREPGNSAEHVPPRIWAVVVLLLIAFAAQNLVEMRRETCTADEVAHLPAGFTYLLKRDFRLNPEHPPLLKILCALPLLALHPRIDFGDPLWVSASNSDFHYQFGSHFLYSNDADRLLFWGRLPIVLIAILLGWFVFRWTQQLYGNTAGLFALGLFAFSPNLIAHSHLVTTDVGVSAFLTIGFYFLWRYRCTRMRRHLGFSSLAMGAALASKFSAAILFPVALLLLWIFHRSRFVPRGSATVSLAPRARNENPAAKSSRHSAKREEESCQEEEFWRSLIQVNRWKVVEIVIFAGIAFAVVQLAYLGSIDPSLFFKGMALVNQNHDPNFPYYFNGDLQPGGRWYYLPASFLLKATAPFIVLVLMRIVLFLANWRREWRTATFLILPAVVYFAAVTLLADPLGVRYFLPIFPFLMVYSAGLVRYFAKKRFASVMLGILLAWHVTSSLAAFPHHLSYFNEFAGGSSHGWEWVGDSNVDWGQELKGLRKLMEQRGIAAVTLVAFSPYDNPDYYGIHCSRPMKSG